MTMTTINAYTVLGITCDHCMRGVSTELAALPGLCNVDVELATGTVTVTSEQPLEPDVVAT